LSKQAGFFIARRLTKNQLFDYLNRAVAFIVTVGIVTPANKKQMQSASRAFFMPIILL
jgi:hypothetical protein